MKLSSIFWAFSAQTILDDIAEPVGLAPTKYLALPLTSIRPTGWLADQLDVQMEGLAGHEHEFYNYVSETDWIGGTSYYSYLEEAGSYWFNAMVPSGILSNHEVINKKTKEFMDYVLDTQDESGWIGPEVNTDKPRYLWGRYPFFFGAIQLLEADPSYINKTIPALHKFVSLANKMLKNDGQGQDSWAKTRWEDFVVVLQWLYDNYPEGNEGVLIETMKLLKWTEEPWELVLSPKYFPKVAVDTIPKPDWPFAELTWHGVNIAEGLKALPSTYRFTHNQSDLDLASTAWDMLFEYHGRPSGAYAADEMLAGLGAVRGTELCLVVEAMFSGSYLFQVTGDLKYADRVERMSYNALPATLTGDMWTRQYLQQQNQVAAKNMTPNPFPDDGPYSNVFGLEPNYPCCTVDFPQGWPKFITNSFVVSNDKTSLVQLYFGPMNVSTTLAHGNGVKVSVKTLYPFGDTVSVNIYAEQPLTYRFRVPSWVEGGTVSMNDLGPQSLAPENGLHAVDILSGITAIGIKLSSPITIENRPDQSVAIHRGPLNYAFDIPRDECIISQHPKESRAVDYEFLAQADAAWEYAIDPSTLEFHHSPPEDNVLPSPVFDTGLSPFTMTVMACRIDWGLGGDTYAIDPPPANSTCIGEPTNITLSPFGTTKLRISEFPVVSLRDKL